MGYAFHAWSLDLGALRTACATRGTYSPVVEASQQAIADYARSFSTEIEDGLPSLEQALRRLLEGDSGRGFPQAYALERVCAHVGTPLPNEGLSAMRWAWAEHVDAELERLGRSFRLAELDDPPVRLPPIADFPMVGFAQRDSLTELTDLPPVEDDLEQAMATLRAWGRAGTDIVTFYY
jgi:hypothetical protein